MRRNADLRPLRRPSAWRKIAVGTWNAGGDPSIYGWIEVDATAILSTIAAYREKGLRLTPTAMVARAVALALREFPVLNSVIRFGRIYQRQSINIFLQASTAEESENLSGFVIKSCDQKSLAEIAAELAAKSQLVKAKGDPEFAKVKGLINKLPGWLVGPLLKLTSFILYDLNIWSPLLNAPQDGFGSAMVTSVGMMGIDVGFAPLVPYSRCPLLLAVGAIRDKAVVVDGEIVVRPQLLIGVTIDHRLADGRGLSRMLKTFRDYVANPS